MLKEGHIVAYEQFNLQKGLPTILKPSTTEVSYKYEGEEITISVDAFKITFNKNTGLLTNYIYNKTVANLKS